MPTSQWAMEGAANSVCSVSSLRERAGSRVNRGIRACLLPPCPSPASGGIERSEVRDCGADFASHHSQTARPAERGTSMGRYIAAMLKTAEQLVAHALLLAAVVGSAKA